MNKTILCIAIIFILAGVSFGVWQRNHKVELSPDNQETNNRISVSEESRTADYSDDKILLGRTHNAFVGKVLRKTGEKKILGTYGPSSQYEVDVLLNIKGNLRNAIVNQFEIHAPVLLQIGSTYVF